MGGKFCFSGAEPAGNEQLLIHAVAQVGNNAPNGDYEVSLTDSDTSPRHLEWFADTSTHKGPFQFLLQAAPGGGAGNVIFNVPYVDPLNDGTARYSRVTKVLVFCRASRGFGLTWSSLKVNGWTVGGGTTGDVYFPHPGDLDISPDRAAGSGGPEGLGVEHWVMIEPCVELTGILVTGQTLFRRSTGTTIPTRPDDLVVHVFVYGVPA